jgi:DNA mismatch repair protein MutH
MSASIPQRYACGDMDVTSGFDGRGASKAEILTRARRMPGHTIADLVSHVGLDQESSRTTKGTVGAAIEAYFGMRADSLPEPDFRAAGIELKSVPLRPREGEIAVKERTFITSIDYVALAQEEWNSATVRRKLDQILFVYYDWLPQAPLGELAVTDVVMWEPNSDMLDVFEADWLSVRDLVRQGRAEGISESQGTTLVAATKGPGGPPDRRQPYSKVLASRRSWALRPAFVRSILEQERAGRQVVFEISTTVADKALQRLRQLVGSTISEVESSLGRAPTAAKHRAKLVVDAALAAHHGPTNADLAAVGVDLRVVHVDVTRMPYEALSFPVFRYQELIREDWAESELLSRLDKFILVPVIAAKGLGSVGAGVIQSPVLWSPSESDLEGMAREWTMFRDEIEAGKARALTPASLTDYIHVRPKGKDSLDTDPAPIVGPVVKKCFWLNRDLVARILRDAVSD